MAFQTRSRNPLLDSNMQAAIEKRGKELIGLLLIGVGLLVAAIIGSYTPDDSNWMVSTDAPVQNMLGQTGATIAFLLITFLGKGSWAIAVFLFAWGTRFLLHKGEGRILWPALMLVFWLIVVALHFETLVPDEEWRAFHNSGLGGMIGNTALGGLLALLPFGLAFLVKSLSFLTAVAMIALGAFVLGFSRDELKRIGRFLLLGVLLAYDMIARLLGRSASGGLQAARTWQHRRAERRAEVIDYEDDALVYSEPMEPSSFTRAEPQFGLHAPAPTPQPQPAAAPVVEERGGLLSRATNLIRRAEPVEMPEPELVEQQPVVDVQQAPGDERIAQKIANAVRIRRAQTTPPEPDPNLPLTKGRGKRPEPLIFNAPAQTAAEPPISAPAQQIPTAPTITSVIPQAPTLEETTTSSPETFFVDEVPTEDLPEEPVATMPSAPVAEAAPRVQITPRADPAPAEHAPVERAAMNIPVAEPRKAVVEQPQRKPVQPSTRAKAEAQPNLFKEDNSDFELPPLSLLTNPTAIERHHLSDEALEENARMLETVLDDYGVKGEIVSVRPGPVVTMYELEPAPGLKASRVIGLADDIARSMSALSARVSTVPGRTVIGIELPNENREKVVLREILASRDFGDGNQNLPLALGKDIGGDSMVANLAKMPHL